MQPATRHAAAPLPWRRAAGATTAAAATVVADSAESLAGLPAAVSSVADEGRAALYIGSLGRELAWCQS